MHAPGRSACLCDGCSWSGSRASGARGRTLSLSLADLGWRPQFPGRRRGSCNSCSRQTARPATASRLRPARARRTRRPAPSAPALVVSSSSPHWPGAAVTTANSAPWYQPGPPGILAGPCRVQMRATAARFRRFQKVPRLLTFGWAEDKSRGARGGWGSCAKPTPPTRERAQCCDGGPAGRPGHPSARARAPGQRAREAREPLLRGGGRGAAGCRAHQVVPARVRLRVCAGALASMRMRVRACAPQRSRPLSAPAALVCAGMEGAPGVCKF